MQEETQNKLSRDQLKVIALRQRIGEIVSEYEEKIADIRATFTQQMDSIQELAQGLSQENEGLKSKVSELEGATVEPKRK